jgi:hypothetical protein
MRLHRKIDIFLHQESCSLSCSHTQINIQPKSATCRDEAATGEAVTRRALVAHDAVYTHSTQLCAANDNTGYRAANDNLPPLFPRRRESRFFLIGRLTSMVDVSGHVAIVKGSGKSTIGAGKKNFTHYGVAI